MRLTATGPGSPRNGMPGLKPYRWRGKLTPPTLSLSRAGKRTRRGTGGNAKRRSPGCGSTPSPATPA